jgi:hypothetical protein
MENILENELVRRMGCMFLKRKPPKFVRFFNKINIFAISLPPRTAQNSFEIKLSVFCVFLSTSVIRMPWIGYPNDLTDFWMPDDGRNRTYFFAASVL